MLRKTPDNLHGVIDCLEMEDHYLRVHSGQNSGLVLYRMDDAETDLKDCDGVRVHRSWWVGRHAIADVITDGGKRLVRLKNGMRVPVARTRFAQLRDEGWL